MILGDSGPAIAMFDPTDAASAAVVRFLGANREEVQFAGPIVAEVAHLLWRKQGTAVEARFLRAVAAGRLPLAPTQQSDFSRAADLVEQYADFPLGTVDALIVAMVERLKVTTILTLDRRHFGALKPAHRESFTLVP